MSSPTPLSAAGYDPQFLGTAVPFPVAAAGTPTRELAFTHFTVLLQPVRKLAVATGVNLDGAQLLDLERGDDWHLDPRVPVTEQTGADVYARNDLDRGHLVRRRDPVWGPLEVATAANVDTFTYVNAAPQAGVFNSDETLWAGLEDYVLGYARASGARLSVFTAPVLDPDDPPYRGVQIPRLFWKVAAWAVPAADGPVGLAATGYVLDQSPELDDLELATERARAVGDPPPLGAYRTYQVPIGDIVALTGLDLGPLVAADRMPAPAPAATERSGWVRLQSYASIRL